MGMNYNTPYVKGWSLIETQSVTGSATTTISFNSPIDLSTAHYKILGQACNNSGGSVHIYLEYNGDTTVTNYYYQQLYGNGAAASASRSNAASIGYIVSGQSSIVDCTIMRSCDVGADYYTRAMSMVSREDPNFNKVDCYNHMWTNRTAPTSIQLVASAANGFDVGTKFQLMRLTF